MGQRGNQKGNYKVFWTKWSQKITYQNLWDVTKAALKGTVIALRIEKKKGFGQWTQLLP